MRNCTRNPECLFDGCKRYEASDVTDGCDKYESPTEPRARIIRNRIACLECLDVIESIHVHDFVWCRCGCVAVDGGRDYLKRVGSPWQDLSECELNYPEIPDSSEVVNLDERRYRSEDNSPGLTTTCAKNAQTEEKTN